MSKNEFPIVAFDQCRIFYDFAQFLINNKIILRVPDYQRPYAWNEAHIETLFNDLIDCEGNYFLGLFLLNTDRDNKTFIIDGQQRITTIFIILNFIRKKIELENWTNIENLGIPLDSLLVPEGQNRIVLQESLNNSHFRRLFDCSKYEELKAATDKKAGYFAEVVLEEAFLKCYSLVFDPRFTEEKCNKVLQKLFQAQLIIHLESNTGMAMKVFELMNDRGKILSDLEVVKSYTISLMYALNATDEDQKDICNYFNDINKILNANVLSKEFNGDDILRYHVTAVCNWTKSDFWYPKKLFKEFLASKRKNLSVHSKHELASVRKELLTIIEDLKNSFEFIKNILEDIRTSRTKYRWFKNLYIIGQLANYYPLFLAINKRFNLSEKQEVFKTVCNYLELFTFRAYVICRYRSDTAQNRFYRLARNIVNENLSKEKIYEELEEIIKTYCCGENNVQFNLNIGKDKLYGSSNFGLRYLLIKYENSLCGSPSSESLEFSDIDLIKRTNQDNPDNATVEHIIAQKVSEKFPEKGKAEEYFRELFATSDSINQIFESDEKKKNEFLANPEKYFSEHFLHSIGNLVFSTDGANKSKGNDLPELKNWNGFQSQHEIGNFISSEKQKGKINVNNKDIELKVNIEYLLHRATKIKKFVNDYWSIAPFEQDSVNTKLKDKFKERPPLIGAGSD